MKKTVAFIIAVLYLAVSSGLVMEVHHCMGRIAGIGLLAPGADQHTCEKCGMEKGAGKCCKDELKFVQLKDTQKPVTTGYQLPVPVAVVAPQYPGITGYLISAITFTEPMNTGPPGYPVYSRCILHCVFRI